MALWYPSNNWCAIHGHHGLPSYRRSHPDTDLLDALDVVSDVVNAVNSVPYWLAPRRQESVQQAATSGASEVVSTDDKLQINLDVRHFKPEELELKCIGDRIVIHGKHEDKEDQHGYIAREFTRSYMLPKDVEAEKIKSNLSPEGILTIEAPKRQLEQVKERNIPIEHVKEDKKEITDAQKK